MRLFLFAKRGERRKKSRKKVCFWQVVYKGEEDFNFLIPSGFTYRLVPRKYTEKGVWCVESIENSQTFGKNMKFSKKMQKKYHN